MTTAVEARSSVLVVVVSRDGIAWLPESLAALAAQTYPRLSIVAVDEGSTDGSRELLESVLGAERVLAGAPDGDVAGALRALHAYPPADAADFLLLLHDDTCLQPEAIARMVEAAQEIPGVERVGVVGPKVVDWEDPRVLRDIGRSVDGLGHPYSGLQEGELDQGQYDRIAEVLYVSSCAMLISTDAWRRTGDLDARFEGHHDEMDFCWRARLAGFRVLVNPLAVARHRGASTRGERSERARLRGRRYYSERAALAAMLKNYSLRSLLLYVPLYLVFSAVRLSTLGLGRRFEEAIELLAAIGWNATHIFGTLRQRRRAQSLRVARDGAIRQFMTSPFRVPRWFERAEEFIEDSLVEDDEEAAARPARTIARVAAAVSQHPVVSAIAVGLIIGWLATRHLRGGDVVGAALTAFPAHPGDFFAEYLAPVRTTLLGGGQGPSPALAMLGGLSFLSFGDPALAQRLLLMALVPATAVTTYRTWRGRVHGPGSGIVATASFVASGVVLWAFSEGRIPLLVLAAVLPLIWSRVQAAFDRKSPPRDARTIGELAIVIAIAVAFLPGAWLALGVLCAVEVVARRRAAPIRAVGLAAAAALALVLPTVPSLVAAPGAELALFAGSPRIADILRMAPGSGPGTGITAWFLPILALLCFAAMPDSQRPRADRAMSALLVSLALAWTSANGFLPAALTNAPVYVLLAAFEAAWIIGLGSAALAERLAPAAAARRAVSIAVSGLLVLGLGGQALAASFGGWAVGRSALPPGWPIVTSEEGEFRVLWLSGLEGRTLPAPGGDARARGAAPPPGGAPPPPPGAPRGRASPPARLR